MANPTTETFDRDNLIAGNYPRVTDRETMLTPQVNARGSLMGRITASGKIILSLAAAGDGSQVPTGILVNDADANAADTEEDIYLSGEFNQDAIIYGAGHTAASVKDGLRDLNIYIKKAVAK